MPVFTLASVWLFSSSEGILALKSRGAAVITADAIRSDIAGEKAVITTFL